MLGGGGGRGRGGRGREGRGGHKKTFIPNYQSGYE